MDDEAMKASTELDGPAESLPSRYLRNCDIHVRLIMLLNNWSPVTERVAVIIQVRFNEKVEVPVGYHTTRYLRSKPIMVDRMSKGESFHPVLAEFKR
jgi:hypothetical protein